MATLDMNDPEDVRTGLLQRDQLLRMTGEWLDALIGRATADRELDGAEKALDKVIADLLAFREGLRGGGL